jgi:two-component system, NarL family, sensor histidine kinase DevS
MPSNPVKTDSKENANDHLHKACQLLVEDISLDSLPKKIAKTAGQAVNAAAVVLILPAEAARPGKVYCHGVPRADEDTLIDSITISKEIAAWITGSNAIFTDIKDVKLPGSMLKGESALGAAIGQGSTHLGHLVLFPGKDAAFTDLERKNLGIITGYAAIALKNALLYEELINRDRILIRRNENMALLDKLASTLATSTEIRQIVEKGLKQLMEHLHIEIGEIFLRQEDSKNINLAIHHGDTGFKLWTREQFVVGEGVIGRMIKNKAPALFDLQKDETPDLNPKIRETGMRHLAVIPLGGRRGVIGALCTATTHFEPLDEMEVQFLQAIGSWMATAIENVNLNTQERRLAVLEERERIGMDLHDGIIQSIYAVGLTLEHAHLLVKENPDQSTKRIEQSIDDLNSTIRDIRAYILDLRPRQLHNEDLMKGILRLVTEFKANTLLDVNLQGPAEDLSFLPKNQALALFHISQEALANIAKHAHAHHVDVVVWTTNDRLLLEIRDDGVGFDPEKTRISIGHGLSNMETRVSNTGGEVDITSEPGKGTTILAWVPLPEEEGLIVE